MGIKFSNNASANIIKALTSTATSVSVTTGKGDLFPSLTEGDYFYATLAGNNGLEIVKVTNRIKDTMTIVRAQDNTIALSFDTGDLFELRIVAADFNDTFSEVNDKLENSIEEITSNVNSALASKAPILHSSSSTEYGAGSSEKYGHLKSHDTPDTTKTAAAGHAFSPAGAAAMQDTLEEQIGDLANVVRNNSSAQITKDAAQDSAINSKVSTVNGLTPDSNGNVDVGGMPLGTLIPYTGKDVPAGTLRADGTTYTNMRASFPEFYAWVVESGITVLLSDYTLIEGSCGYYGLDESTGTVRMPTLAAGVFGTSVASQYGQAIEAGLPNIKATSSPSTSSMATSITSYSAGALYYKVGGTYSRGTAEATQNYYYYTDFDASRSSPVYGNSNTVTPSHVKYPWVIVVYNAAVPPSVAQAGEFVDMLDRKVDKVNPKDSKGNAILTSAGGKVSDTLSFTTFPCICRDRADSALVLLGGSSYANGSFIQLFGKDNGGTAELVSMGADGTTHHLQVSGGGSLVFDGSYVYTSANGTLLNWNNVIAGKTSGSLTFPAGGTWAYVWNRSEYDGNDGWAGIVAGGSTIGINGNECTYFAIRIA